MDRGIPDGVEDETVQNTNQQGAFDWTPDQGLLGSLICMGFTDIASRKALFSTGNMSLEAAIDWIFNNTGKLDTPLEDEIENYRKLYPKPNADNEDSDDFSSDDDGCSYKMVFVVNTSLQMQTGKIAAQVAHAAIGVYRFILENELKYSPALYKWSENGEKKIVLRTDSSESLLELESKAVHADLPCYLVRDAGRTQIAAGSTTVLGIFGAVENVDSVTGNLRLL